MVRRPPKEPRAGETWRVEHRDHGALVVAVEEIEERTVTGVIVEGSAGDGRPGDAIRLARQRTRFVERLS